MGTRRGRLQWESLKLKLCKSSTPATRHSIITRSDLPFFSSNLLSLTHFRLGIETWLWEKEQSHRLFNFHDDYRILDKLQDVIGSSIISKKGPNNIALHKASYYDDR